MIGQAITGVVEAIVAPFRDAYGKVVELMNSLKAKIIEIINAAGPLGNILTGGALGKAKGQLESKQFGGLVSSPVMTMLAEKGTPEMVIPMTPTARSRGLLATTAEALGMGGLMRQGAAGPTNVSVAPNITINGVPAGQEGAIGREIERALQDPVNRLLEQLRRARDEERRLAYV
jgi:hypothetical protein